MDDGKRKYERGTGPITRTARARVEVVGVMTDTANARGNVRQRAMVIERIDIVPFGVVMNAYS